MDPKLAWEGEEIQVHFSPPRQYKVKMKLPQWHGLKRLVPTEEIFLGYF